MKKFKFSLQVLLDVKSKEEKSLKGELNVARIHLFNAQQQLDILIEKFEECQGSLKKSTQSSIKVDQINTYYTHLNKLNHDIGKQKDVILTMKKKCDRLLKELIDIKKMIKMLETLRENKYQDYLKEVDLEDIKLMDDFINSKALNKV